MNSSVTPAGTNILRSPPTVLKSAAATAHTKEPNFFRQLWIVAKSPVEKSGINRVQLGTSVAPVFLGPLALIGLLCANFLKDPDSKPPEDPFWNNALQFAGKAYQPLFQLLTLNNIGIALLLASPARLLTYTGLAVANMFAWHDDWKLIDICNNIRKVDKQIDKLEEQQKAAGNDPQTLESLKAALEELYKQEDDLYASGEDVHTRVSFFGRVIFNFLMAFSFLFYLPLLSRSCRYEPVKDSTKKGEFTGQFTAGFTWKDFWHGHKGDTEMSTTPPYLQLFKERFDNEFIKCPKAVWKEFWANMSDLKRAQGTLWGRNDFVEEQIKKAKGGNNLFNRWRMRLSNGLSPSVLNLANTFVRLGIIGASLGAIGLGGMKALQSSSSPFKSDASNAQEDNELLDGLVDASGAMVWGGRMLSGISGLLIAFNQGFIKTSGMPAMCCQGIGSGLTLASAFAGTNPKLSALDLFLQFSGSIFLFLGQSASFCTFFCCLPCVIF